MTTYTLATTDLAAQAKTLAANTEDIVDFGENVGKVRIRIDAVASGSTAPLYITGDGTTAAVAAANTFGLAAVVGAEMVVNLNTGVRKLHIISAGAHTYSVERG